MNWKKNFLNEARLYLILDREVASYDELWEIAREAVAGGADLIQLRDKLGSAKDILSFSKKVMPITRGRAAYIINDRADIALECGADGVHLGQDDIPAATARRILGDRAIIGQSCQTLIHARRAREDGVDYIGFGSVFKTETKPEREPMDPAVMRRIAGETEIPLFAIGGISLENMDEVLAAGIERVAVCRGICQAPRIAETTQLYKDKLLRGSFNGRMSASQAENAGSIPVPRSDMN